MLAKLPVIIINAVIAVVAGWVYFEYRVPPDVVPQSGHTELIVWITLAATIISLLNALIGLVLKIIELRTKP